MVAHVACLAYIGSLNRPRPTGAANASGYTGTVHGGAAGVQYGDQMYMIFILLVYALLFAVIALTLYWVIRKAVAGGIRDAHVDESRRGS